MLKDAIAVWKALEGQVRKTVKDMSGKSLQCERYDVTTAPNASTGKIGVSQPFGNEIFIPYSAAVASAAVGDTVMVFWWKSLSNAKAWYMGNAIGEGGSVLSVNGKTGAVTLDAADVGALPEAYQFNVGDLFISTNATSPAARFGGTWTQIKDTFLLAAGDTYAAGATGGEAAHTLTENELPGMGGFISPQTDASWGDAGEATYYMPPGNVAQYSTTRPYVLRGGNEIVPRSFTRGGGQAHNNMPPYLAVYVWKRIA